MFWMKFWKSFVELIFADVMEHSVMRMNVAAPEKTEEFEIHPILMDSLFILLICTTKKLWCLISPTAISDPRNFCSCPTFCLSLH